MKYLVKEPLNHDGKAYEPGCAVDLNPEAAAPLLVIKAVEEVTANAPAEGDQASAEGEAKSGKK